MPYHQVDINRIEKVQRTAARWTCRRWRNQSHVREMLEELQWPDLQERRQQVSLSLFYKIHHNLAVVDKNRYLSELGGGSRRTRSHPFQYHHTCDISRFRRELPIWSLSSRSHARETKPPDERIFQCHFSRTVFQSEHFIVYGSIYLANKLFTAQKCLTFIDLIDDH